ncbi:hypothetical protein [Paenibacillus agricola]|uniref:Cyclic nucleotide-binding domain-containing protein n=1 Tax=Paenibacillus agricola TaxID=2716264 RepID=A0ABX0IYF6_9BACL|nr:hypothetical protein [Paenibacillus agricola]NHN28994.1 hypothetical protein [Paenibacillus agricola]
MQKARGEDAELVKKIKRVIVRRIDPVDEVEVDNPTDLPLIAKERKCAVFQLDETRCVKIFRKAGKAEKEFFLLQRGAAHAITPNAYEYGPLFVVMDLMPYPTAEQYIQTNGLTKELASGLLHLLNASRTIGFTGGHAPRDIYVMPDGTLRAVNISDKRLPLGYPPKKLLKGLGMLANDFLQHVKELDPVIYAQWTSHPELKQTSN